MAVRERVISLLVVAGQMVVGYDNESVGFTEFDANRFGKSSGFVVICPGQPISNT